MRICLAKARMSCTMNCMLQAVIFDLDGVLVDSPKYIWRSFREILKDKITFTDDDVRRYLASSLKQNVKSWKERFGVDIGDLMTFSKATGKIQFELMEKEVKTNPTLLHFLEELEHAEIKRGVGTSSMRWRAEKILSMLSIEDYFEILVTANDVEKHKPHPDVFLNVAKKLDVDPEYCVVIEDAIDGIEAAHNGGMKAIGLVTAYHTAEELEDADMVIRDFHQLNVEILNEVLTR